MEPELVAAREVLDLPRHDGAVRDADHGALVGAQARGPERDVLHVAELAADPAGVADAQGPVREDGKAAEHVLEALLRREREHEAADAQARQRRRHVHAEDGKREQENQDDGDAAQRPADERERRSARLAPDRHHAAQQVAVHDVDDPQQHPQENREQHDVEEPVVVDAVHHRDPEPEHGDAVDEQREQQRGRAARGRRPLRRGRRAGFAAQQTHEREDAPDHQPREPVQNRQQQEEGGDLPQPQRPDARLDEKLRQLPGDRGRAELSVDLPRLADRLPRDQPDRWSAGSFAPDEHHVERPVRPQDVAHPVDVGRQTVLQRPPRRAAHPLEAGRHEPLVEDLLELRRDLFALRAQRRRDLQVFRGGPVAASFGRFQEAEEAAVRRVAAVRVAGVLVLRRRRGRRRRQLAPGRPRAPARGRAVRARGSRSRTSIGGLMPPRLRRAAAAETGPATGRTGERSDAAARRGRGAAGRTRARRWRARARS